MLGNAVATILTTVNSLSTLPMKNSILSLTCISVCLYDIEYHLSMLKG